MTVHLGWPLLAALAVLVIAGMTVAHFARLPVRAAIGWAAVRAAVQLMLVSLIVGVALSNAWLAACFVLLMFCIGVATTARRTGLRGWRAHCAAAVAMASGAAPVLAVIFLSGSAPLTGPAIVPIASIIVGNMMTVHTLVGRRSFDELRGHLDEYEAWLSLGFSREQAISGVISPTLHESLFPALDQSRTVGLVSLPGAYIGVLLGGGDPWAAAAAQVLVLIGINTAQVIAVTLARVLMARGLLLPPDLRAALHR